MVPVVHLRRDLGVRGEVAAAEVRGLGVLGDRRRGRAERSLRAAGAVVQVVAPAAALVVDVPLVLAVARAGAVVVQGRGAVEAGGVVRAALGVVQPVAGSGAGRLSGIPRTLAEGAAVLRTLAQWST